MAKPIDVLEVHGSMSFVFLYEQVRTPAERPRVSSANQVREKMTQLVIEVSVGRTNPAKRRFIDRTGFVSPYSDWSGLAPERGGGEGGEVHRV